MTWPTSEPGRPSWTPPRAAVPSPPDPVREEFRATPRGFGSQPGASVEDRTGDPRALELVEALVPSQGDHRVEEPAGSLALGRGRDHRTEERHPVDVDDGGADVHADRIHAGMVRRPQR